MSRPAPPKPPRLRKTKSIDTPRETHTQNVKDLYPPNTTSSVNPSSMSPSSSSHSPPPIPPFKPNGKPAIPNSVAAANIIKALKRAQSVDDSIRHNDPQEDNHNDFSKRKSYTDNSYVIIEEDLSSRTARPVSMFGPTSTSEYKNHSPSLSSIEDTRKVPFLPMHSLNNSYPSKIPHRLPSHHEEEEEEEEERQEDNIRKCPISIQKSLPTSPSGQSTPTTKIPMLPPDKPTFKTPPKRPDPPPKILSRTKSDNSPLTQTTSNLYQKPLPLPPQKSHKISPEESPKPVINDINTKLQEDGIEHLSNHHESTQIPISPSSVSSGVPEDEGEALSCDSRQTTPSCITFSESIFNEGLETRLEASSDEIDGGQPPQQTNKQPHPPLPSRIGQNQPKLKLKSDNWWIQKRQLSPPTSPNQPLTSSTPPISSQPYRSHHIINGPQNRQSSDILANKSKATIGSSGIYYPPAVRSITPEPFSNAERNDSSEDNVEEKDEVPVLKVPNRFQKTRRSNSFNGTSGHKVRPTSMIEDVRRNGKDKNNELSSSSTCTVPRGLTESTKEDYKQIRKMSKRGSTDAAIKSSDTTAKKTVLGLFRARIRTDTTLDNDITKSQEQKKVEEAISEDSSEDETGGTIKRMPKYGSLPRKIHRKSSELASDDYEPEYHQLFEYVFVMGLKEDHSSKKLKTEITYRFPPDSGVTSKDDTLRSIDQFCFPDIEQWKPVVHYNSESFSFVLTSLEGNRRFGYCRRLLPDGKGPRLPEVFCIVSPLGCFDLYAKILDIVEQRRAVSSAAVFSFLKSIIANPFPAPGRSVSIKVLPAKGGDLETIKLKRPHDSRLEHVDFAELYNTLGPKKLIQVFSSIIMERRVILAANRLSTLSSCCHALLALLYPFEWQHTFIPVLPNSLIDFCGSPVPYIIGINPSLIKQLDHLEIEMEEALVVDLDKRKFVRKFGDESSILPSKLSEYLVHMLDAAVIKNEYSRPLSDRRGQSRADEIVVNSFMIVFTYLFGGYKEYLATMDHRTGEKQLQKSDFVHSFHSKSTRRFLDAFLMTQMFDKFIEEREDPVKAQAVNEGLFEMKLPELKERTQEIEIFSTKKRFPWQRKKTIQSKN